MCFQRVAAGTASSTSLIRDKPQKTDGLVTFYSLMKHLEKQLCNSALCNSRPQWAVGVGQVEGIWFSWRRKASTWDHSGKCRCMRVQGSGLHV